MNSSDILHLTAVEASRALLLLVQDGTISPSQANKITIDELLALVKTSDITDDLEILGKAKTLQDTTDTQHYITFVDENNTEDPAYMDLMTQYDLRYNPSTHQLYVPNVETQRLKLGSDLITNFAQVAKTGSYNDLSDKPGGIDPNNFYSKSEINTLLSLKPVMGTYVGYLDSAADHTSERIFNIGFTPNFVVIFATLTSGTSYQRPGFLYFSEYPIMSYMTPDNPLDIGGQALGQIIDNGFKTIGFTMNRNDKGFIYFCF